MGQQRAGGCQGWDKRGQGSLLVYHLLSPLGLMGQPRHTLLTRRSKREQDISEGSGVQLKDCPLPFSLHLVGRASHMFKPKVKRTGEHTRAGEELGTAQSLMGSTLNFPPCPPMAQCSSRKDCRRGGFSHTCKFLLLPEMYLLIPFCELMCVCSYILLTVKHLQLSCLKDCIFTTVDS